MSKSLMLLILSVAVVIAMYGCMREGDTGANDDTDAGASDVMPEDDDADDDTDGGSLPEDYGLTVGSGTMGTDPMSNPINCGGEGPAELEWAIRETLPAEDEWDETDDAGEDGPGAFARMSTDPRIVRMKEALFRAGDCARDYSTCLTETDQCRAVLDTCFNQALSMNGKDDLDMSAISSASKLVDDIAGTIKTARDPAGCLNVMEDSIDACANGECLIASAHQAARCMNR